jgi:alpha-1,6-mannosyltransferase
VLLSGGAAWLSGGDLSRGLLAFKGMGVLAYAVVAVGAYCIVRRDYPERTLPSVLLFGWNPLVLFEGIVNGHNDLLMAALLILAAYSMAVHRPRWSFGLLILSVLVKFVTVILFPAFLLWWLRRRLPRVVRVREAIIGVGLAGTLAGLLFAPFWIGPSTVGLLNRGGHFYSSPWPMLFFMMQQSGLGTGLSSAISALAYLLFALVATRITVRTLIIRAFSGTNDLRVVSFDLLFALFLLGTTWFWPWYVLPVIAIAACLADRMRLQLVLVFSGSIAVNYFLTALFLSSVAIGWVHAQVINTPAMFLPPLVFLIWQHRYQSDSEMTIGGCTIRSS